MIISYESVKHILDTLPIGYYLKRNIPVELSHGMDSYYNPIADKITIGYGLIEQAYEKVIEGKYNVDTEEVIRGLLYHEISHVILTPNKLWDIGGSRNHHKINIFEDERIETVFAHRYMNTNFKKNIIFLTNYDGTEEPQTAEQAFYHVVRYHHGKKEFVDRVAKIIKRYANINRSYGDEDLHKYAGYWRRNNDLDNEIDELRAYVNAILGLYNDIAKDFEEEQENKKSQNGNSSEDNNDQQSSDGQSGDNEENEDQQNSGNNKSKSNKSDDEDEEQQNQSSGNGDSDEDEDSESGDGDDDSESDGDSDSNDSSSSDTASDKGGGEDSDDDSDAPTKRQHSLTDKDVEDLIDTINTQLTEDQINAIIDKALKAVFEFYNDEELMGRLKKIIDEKLKEEDKNGAAISAYSGRFDPRACIRRDDYKWWSQQNVNGDIRRFSKVHFNLFIDNSGSFCENDTQMNTFIQALNKLRSRDFDFDVITINTRIVEWKDTTSTKFESDGGNRLTEEVGRVVRRHTQSQANNYNIILFDGDASPDKYSDGTTAFKYFDGPNTILVTDHQNEKYVKTSIRQAKVIVTADYCAEFIDTICKLLERVM